MNKFKTVSIVIVKCFISLIPFKKIRRKVRKKTLDYFNNNSKKLTTKVTNGSQGDACVIEIFPFHSMLLPSWKYLLEKNGLKTDFLIHHIRGDNIKNPFSNIYNDVNILDISKETLEQLLKDKFFNRYKIVIIATIAYDYDMLPFIKKLQKQTKVKVVAHNIGEHKEFLHKNKKDIIVIGKHLAEKTGYNFVSPSYYGNIDHSTFTKKKTILNLGRITNVKDPFMLINALNNIDKEINDNFEFVISCAKESKDEESYVDSKIVNVLDDFDNVRLIPRVDFAKLYKIIGNSHFLLLSINLQNKDLQEAKVLYSKKINKC